LAFILANENAEIFVPVGFKFGRFGFKFSEITGVATAGFDSISTAVFSTLFGISNFSVATSTIE